MRTVFKTKKDEMLNRLENISKTNLKIYRIENTKRCGPYSISSTKWRKSDHNYFTGRPSPNDDNAFLDCFKDLLEKESWFEHFLNYFDKQVFFGFRNKAQLKKWFSKSEMASLKKLGFKISSFKVEKAYVSDHQVLFLKKHIIRK